MKTEAYQRIFNKLNDVRNKNPGIKYAYLLRPTSNPDMFGFIADADTNFSLPYYIYDLNYDGKIDDADSQVPPGNYTEPVPNYMKYALEKPFYSPGFTSDQWGTYISAYAPVKNETGKTVALFGLDVSIIDIMGN
jgi:hypothetical protein